MNSFQQKKKLCRWSFLWNEKKTMIKNRTDNWQSCFKKTNEGNKSLIIFTIAKQLYQPTLATKSKKLKKSSLICTFRKLSKTDINLLIGASKDAFFGLQFAWISSVYDNRWRKTPQGTSLVIHSFNKHSIVKHLFIETGARLCHICHFVHSTIQLLNISKTLTRDDLLWRIP